MQLSHLYMRDRLIFIAERGVRRILAVPQQDLRDLPPDAL